MCTASSPKVDQSAVDAQKQTPQYLRNPWLDGLSIQNNGMAAGRNSLVIQPGTKAPPVTPTSTVNPVPAFAAPNTNLGLGSGGGFAGGRVVGGGFGIGAGRNGVGVRMQ